MSCLVLKLKQKNYCCFYLYWKVIDGFGQLLSQWLSISLSTYKFFKHKKHLNFKCLLYMFTLLYKCMFVCFSVLVFFLFYSLKNPYQISNSISIQNIRVRSFGWLYTAFLGGLNGQRFYCLNDCLTYKKKKIQKKCKARKKTEEKLTKKICFRFTENRCLIFNKPNI